MANSMFESILGMVTPEMTQSIAGRLGESPSAVQNGLGAATAATLSGLARSSGDPGFMERLMQTVGRAGSQNIAANVASMISAGPGGPAGELGNRLTSLVFGSQQGRIASQVSQYSGLGGTAGGGILKMAGALVLGHLAKLHGAGSLNAGMLAGTLRTEASNLGSHVPESFLSGLGGATHEAVDGETMGRAETVGRSETVDRGPSYAPNVLHAEGPRIPAARGSRWAAPVLAALIGAAVLGWIVHRLVRTPAPITAVSEAARTAGNAATGAVEGAYDTARNVAGNAMPAASSLGGRVNISLPDGTRLSVPSNGVEVRLFRYLQHPAAQAAGVPWFNFDRLLFDTNRASLQPQSNDQLNDVAAILKAYPSVTIRLGGYTDNTGDPNANRLLSEQRADNVMTALVQRGIDPARLSARGYGEDNPVADNSTPAGRQMNRRISIRVASK